MKRNVLFIVMLLAFANVLALSKEEPIKEMGRYFTYFIITPKGEYETMNLWYQRKKDILVGGKEYLQYGGFFEDGGIIDSMVMLRQQGMKCFCYDTKRNTEYVMFDFGLQKGDIYFDDLNDAVYEVTDVRDSIIDDDNLCLIELMSQDGKHDIWLEGIGSIYTGIMRGANVFPGDVYLIRAGNNRFYPNNQYVKTADISATELIWEGKLETAEDWDAYDAWFEAPSNLNAEFADDTLHVWGRLHTSCDILPYAICGLMDNNVDFKLYSNGEVDCYKNYEIDAWIPSFERGTYKVSLYNKTLELECTANNKEPVTFTEGQMATIILPTEPEAGKGKYYRLDRVEGNEIIFEQELQPRAHVPYIIVPSEDFSIEVSAMELDGLRCDTASVEGISFIGSFQKEEVESQEGFYIELIDTTPDCSLSPSGEAGRDVYTIGTLRAYLLVHWDDPYHPGGTKVPAEKMEIVLKDNPNSIEIVNSKSSNSKCYDLSGKMVNRKSSNGKFPRGIYIEGGKVKIY